MRSLPPSFDPAVVSAIDARLDRIVTDHVVTVPWSIESGSRAWGFPSPDSDYDCRFVFIRPVSAYLTPWPERDVIETPLDSVLDVNGWDLIKAVALLVKGNAVLLEWLRSPYVYRGDEHFRDSFLGLAEKVVDRNAIGRHHTHVGLTQLHRYGQTPEMPLKRLFYALRPAITVHWLEQHPTELAPPMDLRTLMGSTEIPAKVSRLVDELTERKLQTRELGLGTPAPELIDYVSSALARGEQRFVETEPADREGRRRTASEFFRAAVRRWGPDSQT